ncbi:hypothetical protein VUJ46_19485 [Chryseobacterium sp. MYb264]|uniref:hypothetical protein n=1 Tax=Chryseobacterium sp. MYb264 TaxID=2745153 RepID=UPI002E12E603|nr:hypothetical protein VUJ46_19485 [Chryseobacterium sp. MYb264]
MNNENIKKNIDDWLKFLNPDEVKNELISASLYIMSYDVLINTIVEKIKDFYTDGHDGKKFTLSSAYRRDVKGLCKKDIILASLLWLKKNEVITEEEIELVKIFKTHRNEIAHEIMYFLTDSSKSIKSEYIEEIKKINFKILKWWFIEVEMQVNEDLSKLKIEELDFNQVLIMGMLPLNMASNILIDEKEKFDKRKNKPMP